MVKGKRIKVKGKRIEGMAHGAKGRILYRK
jgi:hypothetical protein